MVPPVTVTAASLAFVSGESHRSDSGCRGGTKREECKLEETDGTSLREEDIFRGCVSWLGYDNCDSAPHTVVAHGLSAR